MSAVLEERVAALADRVDKLEKIDQRVNDLTVEIRVLSTKVALFSGAISLAVTSGVTLLLKFIN